MRISIKYIVFMAVPLMLASMAEAAAPVGVKWTAHNLGVTNVGGNFRADPTVPGNETEICVFCHTPHNAVPGKRFLWNRNDSTASFSLYTASPTLNFSKNIAISDVSKMCMSCHDGGTALNAMANPRPVVWQSGYDQIGDTWDDTELSSGWGPNIGEGTGNPQPAPGGNLTNDHPISFTYSQSQAGDSTIKPLDGGGNSVGGLPLWGGKVECVTCHDPHINVNPLHGGDAAYRPFLRKPNASSSLCFTCHDK